MKQHERRLNWARTFLIAFVQLGLMLMAPAAHAITKANFDKVTEPFQWETANTVIPGLACDDCAQQIDIGFDFPFAGERFNKAYVSSNGLISFLAPVTAYSNTDLPTGGLTAETSALVMPYWDDLHPGRGGSITYATLGSAPNRRLVVSWNNVPHYSGGGRYNFQAILYETGEVKFQYGSGFNNGASATVGIEVTNDDFIKHSYNQVVIDANSALLFRPQPYVQSVSQPCGSLNTLKVQYSYPMDAGSAQEKQNYDFVSPPTPGLAVTSASLSPDGYTVTLTLNKNLQAGNTYQLRIKDVLSRAGRAINPNPTTRPVSALSGLIGTYYSQYGIERAYHTGPRVLRNDAQVDFDWGSGVPDILPRGEDFSVRWEGYLIPSRTGGHVFRTYSDDGIRLWVNRNKVLDAWNDHGARYDYSSVVNLSAGVAVPIVLEHYERGGSAVAQLYWDEPDGTSGNYAIVPSSALSPCPVTRPTGPDHIRIEHDGQGLTCQPERITLKACANAACNPPLYEGSVTVDLTSPGSGWSADPVTFSGGSTTLQLSVNTAATVTFNATAISPTAIAATRCFVGSSENCQMVFSACADRFTCLETREPVSGNDLSRGRLYTKLAGDAFSFDVAALKSDGTRETDYVSSGGNPRKVTVELVDASSDGACGSLPRLEPSAVQEVTFTAADAGRKSITPVKINRAWRHVKCRVTDATVSPSTVSCSSDGFAIRPKEFSSVSTTQATADSDKGASTTAEPKLKAGSTPFDLTATTIAGYNGTPKINNAQIEPHVGAKATGSVTGGFDAADPNTGIASGSRFTYSEVGYFRFKPNAIYDDGFTGIDSAFGDCSDGFSNTLDATNGKYGCKFGYNAYTEWFGRFVPHHFDTEVSNACNNSFTYSGQPFPLKVFAKNASNVTTNNYQGSFAKTVTLSDANGADGAFRPETVSASSFKNGEADLTLPPSVDFTFTNKLTAPATLKVRANDEDTGMAVGTNEGETLLRSGRLMVERKHEPLETNPITRLPVTAQYWNGSTFVTNTLDKCTTLSTNHLRLDNNEQTNQHGHILVGGSTVNLTGAGTLSDVVLDLNLSAPGRGHGGFVDITPELEKGKANLQWLRYDWNGDGQDEDPRGRASWGMYRGNRNVIYLRERWN